MGLNLSFMDGRPTLNDRQRERYAVEKGKIPTRLAARIKQDKDEAAAEKQWKADVWARDKGKCRKTGIKLLKTLRLDPKRGERHHIAGRADRRVRWDPRAAILVSLEVHQQLTQHKLRIVGTKFFEVDGKRYIDATYPVLFEAVK